MGAGCGFKRAVNCCPPSPGLPGKRPHLGSGPKACLCKLRGFRQLSVGTEQIAMKKNTFRIPENTPMPQKFYCLWERLEVLVSRHIRLRLPKKRATAEGSDKKYKDAFLRIRVMLSARPLEMLLDASDYGWSATPTQRPMPNAAPKVIVSWPKNSFPDVQQR